MERAAGLFLSALIAVLLTMLFLAVFAFAMLKGNLSASVEKIGLIVMSVMACFVGGFLCGKKNIKTVFMGAWRRCFILLVFWSNTCRDGAGICDRYNSIFYNDALLCGRRNAWRNVKLKSSFSYGRVCVIITYKVSS